MHDFLLPSSITGENRGISLGDGVIWLAPATGEILPTAE